MISCRGDARKARQALISESGQGHTVEPAPYHQSALLAAECATERLEWLGKQKGQMPYVNQRGEIVDAVRSDECVTLEEAIAQLEGVADVFERQLASGAYW